MIVDHPTALEDATYKQAYSNLARAYLDYASRLTAAEAENVRLREELAIAQGAVLAMSEWVNGYRIRGRSEPEQNWINRSDERVDERIRGLEVEGATLRAALRSAKWLGCKTDPHEFSARAVYGTLAEAHEAYQALVAFCDAEPSLPQWVRLYREVCSREAQASVEWEAENARLREEVAFWIECTGRAVDALDECAGDDEEGWDRQQHAEKAAAQIRKRYQNR